MKLTWSTRRARVFSIAYVCFMFASRILLRVNGVYHKKRIAYCDLELLTVVGDSFRAEDLSACWRTDMEKCASSSSTVSMSRTSSSASILRSWSVQRCLEVVVWRPSSATLDPVERGNLLPSRWSALPSADMINHVALAPSSAPTPNRATLVTTDRSLTSDDSIYLHALTRASSKCSSISSVLLRRTVRNVIIIIIDNRGLNTRWCLTPLLLSLPTAA